MVNLPILFHAGGIHPCMVILQLYHSPFNGAVSLCQRFYPHPRHLPKRKQLIPRGGRPNSKTRPCKKVLQSKEPDSQTDVQVHTHTHTRTHTHTHTHTHTCAHTHARTHARGTHTHTYIRQETLETLHPPRWALMRWGP